MVCKVFVFGWILWDVESEMINNQGIWRNKIKYTREQKQVYYTMLNHTHRPNVVKNMLSTK